MGKCGEVRTASYLDIQLSGPVYAGISLSLHAHPPRPGSRGPEHRSTRLRFERIWVKGGNHGVFSIFRWNRYDLAVITPLPGGHSRTGA